MASPQSIDRFLRTLGGFIRINRSIRPERSAASSESIDDFPRTLGGFIRIDRSIPPNAR